MKLLLSVLFAFLFFAASNALVLSSAFRPQRLTTALNAMEVATTAEIPPGERKLVETDKGTVIVANVEGEFFAVNAKCPHLGLPMKKGAITSEGGVPTITCNFHNSKFSMKDGSCQLWCDKVLGIPGTGFLAGAMGNVGGAKNSPADAYPVTVTEEGKVLLDL